MDHKTFARQCNDTMAAINKLTASYHQLERPEWAVDRKISRSTIAFIRRPSSLAQSLCSQIGRGVLSNPTA
jgi:hypothetical protein